MATVALAQPPATAPPAIDTWHLCQLIGPQAQRPGVYGTDLGFTFVHSYRDASGGVDERLVFLFGDTWPTFDSPCTEPPWTNDDTVATLRVADLPDYPAGPPAGGEGNARCPVLDFGAADPLHDRPLRVVFEGRDLNMSYNRTPLAGWSDGRRVFGLFTDADDATCSSDADCGSGTCLKGELGRCGVDPCPPGGECPRDPGFDSVLAPPVCRVGSDECAVAYSPRRRCVPELEGRGLCVDPTNSLWLTQSAAQPQRPDRRLLSTHWVYVAAEDPDRPNVFQATTRFATAKFLNPAARTVAAFDPDDPSRNDYRAGRDTLLVWGRPWWSATGGARSLVYLLYNELAPADAGGTMRWSPRYFAGYREDGRPRWSDREADAVPLYDSEFDVVNQLSVSWVEPLRAWVMLYGGDQLVTGGAPEARTYEAPEPGAVHLRWAAHPWGAERGDVGGRGAWSDPVPVLRPRDVPQLLACRAKDEAPGCVAGDKVRPIDFFRARLTGAECRTGSGGFDRGFFYSAGVIDALTRSVTPARSGARAAEIVWLVSTWNPYAVELLKSRIEILSK